MKNIAIFIKRHKPLKKLIGLFSIGFVLFFSSCEDDRRGLSFYNEDAILILDYMEENEELYSSFLEICKKGGIAGSLNAFNPYGDRYTLFLPDNQAIDNYIAESDSYASLEDLLEDTDFVRIFCRYHLINTAYRINDFPLGALKDTTATGDFISISFQSNFETGNTIINLNNESTIVIEDIEAVNGIIHTIDSPLTPVTFSSFEWLQANDNFSIMTRAFQETGLNDTMGVFRTNAQGETIRNIYTLLVEPDSVLEKRGITSFDDLVEKFGTPGLSLSDLNNTFYQFVAYHIMEGDYFLDGLETGVYNTYASFPLSISVGTNISINRGFRVVDTIVSGGDTTFLNFVPVNLTLSNNPSKNGPVHVITEILELYKPKTGDVTYQFYDESLINEVRNIETTHLFDDPDKMLKFNWSGTKYLVYENGTGESEEASMKDYLYLDGTFLVEYLVPKTPSGSYNLIIRAHSKLTSRATIQVFLDGKRVGSTLNLSSTSSSDWINFRAGSVDLDTYSSHVVRIEAIVPGQFAWDFVRFEAIED